MVITDKYPRYKVVILKLIVPWNGGSMLVCTISMHVKRSGFFLNSKFFKNRTFDFNLY